MPSQQKLKQHQNIHQDGFDIRLRQKLEEVSAIDTNDVRPDEREIIWNKFDLKCDECSVEFRALNEAQVHYLNAHNNNRSVISMFKYYITYSNLLLFTFLQRLFKML